MGINPRPFLPVDSASNCSSHRPNRSRLGDIMKVTLSRPRSAFRAMNSPSSIPGFDSSSARHRSAMAIALAAMSFVGIPQIDAGNIPNAESAENLPPTFAGVSMWTANSPFFARSANGVPESEIAMK